MICVEMAMQVTLCEQLTSYLTRFKPAAQNTAAATASAAVEMPGMQLIKKKGTFANQTKC